MAVKKAAKKKVAKKVAKKRTPKKRIIAEYSQIHVGSNFNLDRIAQELAMDGAMDRHLRDEQMKVDNVMTQAQAIIYGDREKTYGRPELNLQSIADFWKVYLKRKGVVQGDPTEITINDVCQMMVLLKTARLINQPDHHDSQVDQIGYIGLQERCRA